MIILIKKDKLVGCGNKVKNLIETAIAVGNFKTLISIVQETGLIESLTTEGQYTVFAPTDEAFSKISPEIFEDLLIDKERLTEVLTYHIIPKKLMSNEVIKIKNAKTVNGEEIKINSANGVKIDNAKVIKPDIECSNGVIHVIDKVLIPK